MAERSGLLNRRRWKHLPRVRIPDSPPDKSIRPREPGLFGLIVKLAHTLAHTFAGPLSPSALLSGEEQYAPTHSRFYGLRPVSTKNWGS